MRKKVVWGLIAAALIVTPAVIGILVVGGDSGRTQGALVAEGSGATYQLTFAPTGGGAPIVITPPGQAIAVESYSWSVENPTTIGSATGGAGAGKAKFNALLITKKIDQASPLLFKAMASGAHSPSAVLKLFKGGETKGAVPYATYTLNTAFITKLDHSGASDDVPSEQITLVYGSVTLQVAGQDASGKLSAPSKAGWDQIQNKEVLQ